MNADPQELEKRLEAHLGKTPDISPDAYIDPKAVVVGDVTVGAHASVWPGVVLRGDINFIKIGEGTNLQDGTVVHVADDYGATVGNNVTVGHLALIHACTIHDQCLIGMHATILDGAEIGEQSIVGAGALVTKGMKIPPGSLVLGAPAKVVKQLDDATRAGLLTWAQKYQQVGRAHKRFHAKNETEKR